MSKLYETLEKNYIKFERNKISIIIDNDDIVWFNAIEIANSLEYSYPSEVIKKNIDKSDKIQLKNINTGLKINKHPHSIYLSESGLYSLILHSKLPKAKKFKQWITSQVLPSIRKYGYYKLKKEHENELGNIMKNINKIKELKNELRKEKYPSGGAIYAIDYSTDDSEIYRIGMTNNMNLRKKLYDTHSLLKRKVILIKETLCPIKLETCLRAMLYDKRFKNKKDFYECELSFIKKALRVCIKSIEKCGVQTGGKEVMNKLINKKMQRIELLESKIDKLDNKLNRKSVVKIRIL
jgi:prophage antirepressor-like protein